MELFKREYLLNRIVAGYIPYRVGDSTLYIRSPKQEILYYASEKFCGVYANAIAEGLMTDEDAYAMLIDLGMWTEEDERRLNIVFPRQLEDFKELLYKSMFNSDKRKKYRACIDIAKKEIARLYNIRHSFDHATGLGVANYAKFQYIVEKSTYLPNGKRYNWEKSSPYLAMIYYQDKTISEETIRELAHTQPWDSMWIAGKYCGSLFGKPAINLSLEQQRLISWSALYDNIRESPDCPSDEVIDDDDVLDGWLIIQRKERESRQAKTQGEKLIGNDKIASAQEIYLPASNLEDAKKVDLLNDNFSRSIKKQRFAAIEKHGQVNETSLPDIKQDIMIEMNKMMSNSIKRGR